jgi:hypothetical protein
MNEEEGDVSSNNMHLPLANDEPAKNHANYEASAPENDVHCHRYTISKSCIV